MAHGLSHRPQTDHPVKLLAIGDNAEANKSRKYFLKCAQVELVFGLRLYDLPPLAIPIISQEARLQG